MDTPTPPPKPAHPLSAEQLAAFERDGMVIVRGLFAPDELEVLRATCDPARDLSELQTEVRDGARTYKVAIWTRLDESLFGKLPRVPRVVRAAEALLGEPVYHWHSKLLRKLPGDGGVGIHQDYATWYEDGCLGPQMLTCTVAIHRNDRANGCVAFVPGSHKLARIHRVRLGETSDTHGPEPARVAEILRRRGQIHGELEPGDALFFHCMTLHASGPNLSATPRTVVHLSYNAVSNQPIPRPGQAHHRYRPLALVADDYLRARDYSAVYEADTFHARETEDDPAAGIFYRQRDQDVDGHG